MKLESGNGNTYVFPSIKSPEPSIDCHGPVREIGARALKPIMCFPFLIWRAFPSEACNRNHNPNNGDPQQSHKFQEHEDIPHPHPQFSRYAIQDRHQRQTSQRNPLVDPHAHIFRISPNSSPCNIFPKYDSDDGRGPGSQHEHCTPHEQEACQFTEDLGQVDLCSAIEWYGAPQLCIARRARPG